MGGPRSGVTYANQAPHRRAVRLPLWDIQAAPAPLWLPKALRAWGEGQPITGSQRAQWLWPKVKTWLRSSQQQGEIKALSLTGVPQGGSGPCFCHPLGLCLLPEAHASSLGSPQRLFLASPTEQRPMPLSRQQKQQQLYQP